MTKCYTLDQLLLAKGRLWEKYGYRRVYFNAADAYGLDIALDHTGNVSSALLVQLDDAKIWYDLDYGRWDWRIETGPYAVRDLVQAMLKNLIARLTDGEVRAAIARLTDGEVRAADGTGTLVIGRRYDVEACRARFVGWTAGTGHATEGHTVDSYFSNGIYLGPDESDIAPLFQSPHDPNLEYRGIS
jgi:hypothetical protein